MRRVWQALGVLGCLWFLFPVVATWRDPGVPWSLRLLALAILAITVARPAYGLMVLAGTLPVMASVHLMSGAADLDVPEVLMAPFLLVAGMRLAIERGWPPGRLGPPAVVLGAVIATSAIADLAGNLFVTTDAGALVTILWQFLTGRYLTDSVAFSGLHNAMHWIEPLALAVVAERVLRRDEAAQPTVVRMFLFGGAMFAVPPVVRFLEISMSRADPMAAAIEVLRTLRLHSSYQDINAAGSSLVLFVVPLAWLAIREQRFWTSFGSMIALLALWLTRSRAAIVTAIIGLGSCWLMTKRVPLVRLLLGATLALALAVPIVLKPVGPTGSSPRVALGVRYEFLRVSLELSAAHPVFGLGLGYLRAASAGRISPRVVAVFPAAANGENAHNNFVQILAELGITGLASFLWLLVALGYDVRRTIAAGRSTAAWIGLTGGVMAFLLTCLSGHPLLVAHSLLLFLVAVGLTAGLSAPLPEVPSRWPGRIATVAVILLVATLPIRVALMRASAPLRNVVIGASGKQEPLDDVEYRVAQQDSTWYVPSSAIRVTLPLRLKADSGSACAVDITIDGHHADTVAPVADSWLRVGLALRDIPTKRKARRIDLHTRGACTLLVGTPIIHSAQ